MMLEASGGAAMDPVKQAMAQLITGKTQQNWDQLVHSPFLRSDELLSILAALQSSVVTNSNLLKFAYEWPQEIQLVVAAQRNSVSLIELFRNVCSGLALSPKERAILANETMQPQEFGISKTLKEVLYFAHQRVILEKDFVPKNIVLNQLLALVDSMNSIQTRWVCLSLLLKPSSQRVPISDEFENSIVQGMSAQICLSALLLRSQINPAKPLIRNTLGNGQMRAVQQRNKQIQYTLEKINENHLAELVVLYQQNIFPGSKDILDVVRAAYTQYNRDIFEDELKLMSMVHIESQVS